MGTGEVMSLTNLSAAEELFDQELDKVLADILDPNKKAEAVRTVTLTLAIKPGKERDSGNTALTAKSTLAPREAHTGKVWIDHDGEKPVAVEEHPSQRPLFPREGDEPDNVTSIDQKREGEQK